MTELVRIEKLVHGGQGMGVLQDGKKVFVWNALPGEAVMVRLTKKKRDYAEGIAEEVVEASPERVDPIDDAFLSTSPWQILEFEAENRYKQTILQETLRREAINVADDIRVHHMPDGKLHYRNKMEYSFWGDEDGLHLALFYRGSHGKQIVSGSSIARPEIDVAARKILQVLDGEGIRASQLKTVVLRCNQAGDVVVALFVKDETFPDIPSLGAAASGLAVYFSNPKSPASIITRELYRYGDVVLRDAVLGMPIRYDVNSFFQVNLPMFEEALRSIREATTGVTPLVDFYSGVGTIGIPIGADLLVESDEHNIAMATTNIGSRPIRMVHATAEDAIGSIPSKGAIIVDPPRAGLHRNVSEYLLKNGPERLIYLSCNPITQARDLALLQSIYRVVDVIGYNFFPRTPHIESLVIMERK